MDQRPRQENWEEEMVDDNFITTQHLASRLDSHSTTLSFTMETMSQHRALINQLQVEVDFLRRQGERLEELHWTRAQDYTDQSQSEEWGSRVIPILPDLNIALDMTPKEARSPKDKKL
jgi:hypothetical protein